MVQKLFNLDKGLQKVEQRRFNAQYYDKESEDYDPDSFLSGSAADIEDHFIPPYDKGLWPTPPISKLPGIKLSDFSGMYEDFHVILLLSHWQSTI